MCHSHEEQRGCGLDSRLRIFVSKIILIDHEFSMISLFFNIIILWDENKGRMLPLSFDNYYLASSKLSWRFFWFCGLLKIYLFKLVKHMNLNVTSKTFWKHCGKENSFFFVSPLHSVSSENFSNQLTSDFTKQRCPEIDPRGKNFSPLQHHLVLL